MPPPPSAPSPEGLRLTRATFADLPDWRSADPAAALLSFQRGCAVMAKRAPDHAMGYAGTAADWRAVCGAASGDARAFFESQFTPYAIAGEALFTGYYEPQISVSRTRQGDYQTPVYGLPSDLVSVDLGQFISRYKGETVSGRLSGQRLVPYAERAEIEAKGIANAPILFWSNDPVAVFFLQIQGSGRGRFEDGSQARIAFAGVNGRPYTAIGRPLIERGALEREKVSMASIRDWLKANPAEAPTVMNLNQSYVFFREAPLGDPALGATGSLNVPLTPLASLAVDARLHPLGVPFFVVARGPDPVAALLIGQDTGGAIRGPARGDIFFGFGADAERRAGEMKSPGTLYVLLPNAVAQKIGQTFAP